MAKLLADPNFFSETQPEELDIFSMPPTQTAVERTYISDTRPISSITSTSAPVEFNISGQNGLDYIDLKRTSLYVKCKIVHEDGSDLDALEECGPVNMLLQALWSQVDVSLQGKLITSSNVNYPYKAVMQALIYSSQEEQESEMTSELFYKDTAAAINTTDIDAGGNIGLFNRWQLTKGSVSVDLEGPIYHDIFRNMNRYLINQVDVQIKLYRNNAAFCLMSGVVGKKYAIILEDIVLRVFRVSVAPSIIYAHNTALSSTTCKYPFKRTEIRMQSLPKGQTSFVWDQIFQGLRPTRMTVAFVNAKAVTGDLLENPFAFSSFDLSQITLLCDGAAYGDAGPLKLNYDKTGGQTVMPAFMNLLRGSGSWRSNKSVNKGSININREEFAEGYTLYVFPLEPVLSKSDLDGSYLHLQRQGSLRLECQFGTPLPKTVNCIVLGEFQDMFQIEKSRNILIHQ